MPHQVASPPAMIQHNDKFSLSVNKDRQHTSFVSECVLVPFIGCYRSCCMYFVCGFPISSKGSVISELVSIAGRVSALITFVWDGAFAVTASVVLVKKLFSAMPVGLRGDTGWLIETPFSSAAFSRSVVLVISSTADWHYLCLSSAWR